MNEDANRPGPEFKARKPGDYQLYGVDSRAEDKLVTRTAQKVNLVREGDYEDIGKMMELPAEVVAHADSIMDIQHWLVTEQQERMLAAKSDEEKDEIFQEVNAALDRLVGVTGLNQSDIDFLKTKVWNQIAFAKPKGAPIGADNTRLASVKKTLAEAGSPAAAAAAAAERKNLNRTTQEVPPANSNPQ